VWPQWQRSLLPLMEEGPVALWTDVVNGILAADIDSLSYSHHFWQPVERP